MASLAPKHFSKERALQLLVDHELDFLDLCRLVSVYAERIDGSVVWDSPRVVVNIRQPAAAARIARRRGVKCGGSR
jgi:hypothetical protein